jgi:hypothetical protein
VHTFGPHRLSRFKVWTYEEKTIEMLPPRSVGKTLATVAA